MSDYDGEIKLGVDLSTNEIKKSASNLQKEIDRVFNASSGKKADQSFQRLQSQMSKASQKASELTEKLNKLEESRTPTDEYAELERWLQKCQLSLGNLQDKQVELAEHGKKSSEQYAKNAEEIEHLKYNIEEAKEEMKLLVEQGKAFKLGEDTEAFQKTSDQLANVNNEMRMLLEKSTAYDTTGDEVVKVTNKQQKSFKSFGSTLMDVASRVERLVTSLAKMGGSLILGGLKKLASALTGVGRASHSSGTSFLSMLKTFALLTIGMNTFRAAVNKLRSAITYGINNLVQFNGGVNSTNVAMSSLVSSLNYLKNSWSAAFAPIISYVAPVLTYLMDMIAAVANRIGMLFAALTGKSSFTRAKKTSTDYAASLSGGGGSKGKTAQEKYEEAKKKAQERYDKQVAKVEEQRAKAAAKAEEQQAKAAAKLAKEQEKANKQLGYYDKLNVIGVEIAEDLEDAYDIPEFEDPILEEVDWDDFADAGGAAIEDMFEEVPIDSWATELADKIKAVLADLFEPLKKAWDEMGDYVIDGWKQMTKKLKSLFTTIAKDFIKVWKQQKTVDIFKNILGIVGDIERVIGNIAENLEKAWKKNDTGLHILENIRDIFGIIIQHVRNVTSYMVEWSRNLNFSPLLESVEDLLEHLKKVADFLGGVFEDVMKNLVLPFIKYLVEEGLPKLNEKIDAIIDAVDWDLLRENLDKVWTSIESLLEAITDGLITAFGDLGLAVADFVNSEAFTTFIDNLANFIKSIKGEDIAKILEGIGLAVLKIAEGVIKFINGIVGSEAFQALMKALTDWWNSLSADELANGLTMVATAIIGFKFAQFVGNAYTSFLGFLNKMQGGALAADLTKTAGGFTSLSDAIGGLNGVIQSAGWTTAFVNELERMKNIIVSSSDYKDRKSMVEGAVGDVDKAKASAGVLQDVNDKLEAMGITAGGVKDDVAAYLEVYNSWVAAYGEDLSGLTTEQSEFLQNAADSYSATMQIFESGGKGMEKQFQNMNKGMENHVDEILQEAEKLSSGLDKATKDAAEAVNKNLTEDLGNSLKEANATIKEQSVELPNGIKEGVDEGMEAIDWAGTFEKPATDFDTFYQIGSPSKLMAEKGMFLIQGLQEGIEEAWEPLMIFLTDELEKLQTFFEEHWTTIEEDVTESWDNIKQSVTEKYEGVRTVINTTSQAIKNIIREMVTTVSSLFKTLSSNIASEVSKMKSSINSLGSAVSSMIAQVQGSVSELSDITNSTMSNLGNVMTSVSGTKANIPHLAQGAVIPPRSEFLAVLGDQKSGMNIETPLKTMVEAFQIALDEHGGSSNTQPIVLQLDGRTVAEVVWDEEDKRYKQRGGTSVAFA